jgi:hypothetical protein
VLRLCCACPRKRNNGLPLPRELWPRSLPWIPARNLTALRTSGDFVHRATLQPAGTGRRVRVCSDEKPIRAAGIRGLSVLPDQLQRLCSASGTEALHRRFLLRKELWRNAARSA